MPPPWSPSARRSGTDGRGSGRIAVFVETGGAGTVEIELPRTYALDPALRGEIGALDGVSSVQALPAARAG